MISEQPFIVVAPLCIDSAHARQGQGLGKGAGAGSTLVSGPTPAPLRAEQAYFIGENAAGIRILFCWLTKNSRVLGGQFGSFCDSARIFARSARSL
jgi:hypothetical protein